MITDHQDDLSSKYKGKFRDCDVWVCDKKAIPSEEVPNAMSIWLDSMWDMDPIESHISFEKIHPFRDGNGRTGRMLYWYHCLRIDKYPILFTSDHHSDYYRLFY